MLTLESKFSEFIELCRKAGACADAGEAIPVMEKANAGEGMIKDGTCKDGFELYLKDEKFPVGWALWVLDKVGKDMDEGCRAYFISKIKSPLRCFKLSLNCPFLSEKEITLLKGKYEGDKDVARAVICLEAIQKNRDFNTVRVNSISTCKTVLEAKTLIESAGYTTALSVDTAEKSSDDLKNTLEIERAKITEATKQVIVGQGFGGVAEFYAWFEVA